MTKGLTKFLDYVCMECKISNYKHKLKVEKIVSR